MRSDTFFTITIPLIEHLCLFPGNVFHSFLFGGKKDRILSESCWVYDFDSCREKLLREIVIASVGSIVVSRGFEDKKKGKKTMKLIMNSVIQRVVKYTP